MKIRRRKEGGVKEEKKNARSLPAFTSRQRLSFKSVSEVGIDLPVIRSTSHIGKEIREKYIGD